MERNIVEIKEFEGRYASKSGNILRRTKEGRFVVMHKKVIPSGYVQTVFGKSGKTYYKYNHRLIWTAFNGEIGRGMEIDHINGDKSDNRLSNLRCVTRKQNARGFKSISTKSGSAYRGVYFSKAHEKWVAEIGISSKPRKRRAKYLDTEVEAALAWNDFAIKYGFAEESLNKI